MIQELLNKLADGVAGLFAKVFGDLGLLQAGLVNQVGQGFDTSGRRERDKQPNRIRQIAAAFPVRVNGDGNLGIHARRIGYKEAQFEPVSEDAEAFACGEQHALGDAGVAKTVGEAAPGRGVKVGVEVHAPHAQFGRAVPGDEQRAAVFFALAGLDGLNRFDASVAELGEQRFDDVVLHAQAAAVRDEQLEPRVAVEEAGEEGGQKINRFF